jgi:hypothetical protein
MDKSDQNIKNYFSANGRGISGNGQKTGKSLNGATDERFAIGKTFAPYWRDYMKMDSPDSEPYCF